MSDRAPSRRWARVLDLRWGALVLTDRRWGAPLAAGALVFGIIGGTALGPGSGWVQATSAPVVEIPADPEENPAEPGPGTPAPARDGGSGDPGTTVAPPQLAAPAPLTDDPAVTTTEPADDSRSSDPAPGEDDGQTLSGTVIHVNPAAGSYTIASGSGEPYAIHAKRVPKPATKVSVPVRLLANATFAEDGERERTGRGGTAKLSGVVTYVDPRADRPGYVVSRLGVSVLVRTAGEAPPALGSFVTVTAGIDAPEAPSAPPTTEPAQPTDPYQEAPRAAQFGPLAPRVDGDPCEPGIERPGLAEVAPAATLREQSRQEVGDPVTYSDFQGIVRAVCADTGRLVLSADDINATRQEIAFTVPPEIDLGVVAIGDSVAATATIGADGSLALAGLASDEGIRGANDDSVIQGDLASG